jgi:hypothetical protein
MKENELDRHLSWFEVEIVIFSFSINFYRTTISMKRVNHYSQLLKEFPQSNLANLKKGSENLNFAFKLYKVTSKFGLYEWIWRVGGFYSKSNYGKYNPEKWEAYSTKTHSKNCINSSYFLAFLFQITEKDQLAYECFTKVRESGNCWGTFYLGVYNFFNYIGTGSYQKALEFYVEAGQKVDYVFMGSLGHQLRYYQDIFKYPFKAIEKMEHQAKKREMDDLSVFEYFDLKRFGYIK